MISYQAWRNQAAEELKTPQTKKGRASILVAVKSLKMCLRFQGVACSSKSKAPPCGGGLCLVVWGNQKNFKVFPHPFSSGNSKDNHKTCSLKNQSFKFPVREFCRLHFHVSDSFVQLT